MKVTNKQIKPDWKYSLREIGDHSIALVQAEKICDEIGFGTLNIVKEKDLWNFSYHFGYHHW